MVIKRKFAILTFIALMMITLFLTLGLNINNYEYALSKRIPKIIGIILTGGAIATSSIIFQTISNNRILTPSVLGLDALYMFIQTFVVFMFGVTNVAVMNDNVNFVISTVIMASFSIILFKVLFNKERSNIFLLLLIGIIFGTLFQSLTSFMQLMIEPKAFLSVQDKMFASFNNINNDLIIMAIVVFALTLLYLLRYIKFLDAMSLGRDEAINLGIPYDKIVKNMLIVVSILVSTSTALVGPITFLGLIVANLTYEFMRTYRHKNLILAGILISIIALVGGQLVIERLLNFKTTISVIINLVGGLYFIYLLLKESKAL